MLRWGFGGLGGSGFGGLWGLGFSVERFSHRSAVNGYA